MELSKYHWRLTFKNGILLITDNSVPCSLAMIVQNTFHQPNKLSKNNIAIGLYLIHDKYWFDLHAISIIRHIQYIGKDQHLIDVIIWSIMLLCVMLQILKKKGLKDLIPLMDQNLILISKLWLILSGK